jgi:hypothetical protein
MMSSLKIVVAAAFLVLLAGAAPESSAGGGGSNDPGADQVIDEGGPASPGCRNLSLTSGTYDFSMTTSFDYCWNGSAVTSVSPTGGSSTVVTPWSWTFKGFPTNSYCCVGQWSYYIHRVAWWEDDFTGSDVCIRHRIDVQGNGAWQRNGSDTYNC